MLGMAISARFLLNQSAETWAMVLDFVVLLGMFLAVVRWVRGYRSLMGWDEITFGQTVKYVFELFVVAAVFSSVVKWWYFTEMRPGMFEALVNDAMELVKEAYPSEVMDEVRGLMTAKLYAVFSGVMNALLGLAMGVVEWPMIRNEQQMKKRMQE